MPVKMLACRNRFVTNWFLLPFENVAIKHYNRGIRMQPHCGLRQFAQIRWSGV
jgi:hypothetical protein